MNTSLSIAQRLGASPVDIERRPAVNLANPNTSEMVREICQNLPPSLIFRRNDAFITVSRARFLNSAGYFPIDIRPMDSKRLITFLADHLIFQKGTGDKARQIPLSKTLADTILASDTWHDSTPELETVIPVRLPTWGPPTAEGHRTITLSPPGYNTANKVYTIETLDYTTGAERHTPAALQAIWDRLTYTFPWRPEAPAEERQIWHLHTIDPQSNPVKTIQTGPQPCMNRSACCTAALMLGQYCRLLVDDVMPIGLFTANQQGSGKSLLAWLCVIPVWGEAPGTAAPESKDEMIKALNAALIHRRPYHMLDDIPSLINNTINMIATSHQVEGRRLGGLDMFVAKNHMQIFATGNDVATSADIERRSLIVDLFSPDNVLKRDFGDSLLTRKALSSLAMRADLLRWCHSMVMNWADAGCPSLEKPSAKPSYESFAEIIGSILRFNGFISPFRERIALGEGGDMLNKTIIKFITRIVGEEMYDKALTTHTYRVSELIELSNRYGYTETITSGKTPANSMGKRLARHRGKTFIDKHGRQFQFGRTEEAGSSLYTFTVLTK